MIHFFINIQNPFKHDAFKSYWQGEYSLTRNKTAELGFYKYAWNLFELQIDLRWQGSDHAGPSIELGLFGYTVRFGISDNRHWNSVTNDWE